MSYVFTSVKDGGYLSQVTKYYFEIEFPILIHKYLERKYFHKTWDKKLSFLEDT